MRRISASCRGQAMEGETVTERGRITPINYVDGVACIRLQVWVDLFPLGTTSCPGQCAVPPISGTNDA